MKEKAKSLPKMKEGPDGAPLYEYGPYQDEEGRWHCGARTKTGLPCKAFIKGDRPCPRHRKEKQRSKGKGVGRRLVTGRYSKYLEETLKDRYEDFLQDKDLLDLRHEIALLRAAISSEAEIPLRTLTHSMDVIGRLVDRIIQAEERRQYYIHIERLQVLQTNIVNTILSFLKRCPHCGEALDDLRFQLADELERIRLLEPIAEMEERKSRETTTNRES